MKSLGPQLGLGWLLFGVMTSQVLAAPTHALVPKTTVSVTGANAPIEIQFDTEEVPHIRAQDERDAHFGLGYVHAEARLEQMEVQRRLGRGKLAEIIGPTRLDSDRLMRTLGLGKAAKQAWQRTAPATRNLVKAYVQGVNGYLFTRQGQARLTALVAGPLEPWQPEDVLLWPKVVAYTLSRNWDEEILRTRLLARVGPERTQQLLPGPPNNSPYIVPDEYLTTLRPPNLASRGLDPSLIALGKTTFPLREALGLGSNAWVVHGSRTTTGKPFLANDPHTRLQSPSLWYVAHLTGGSLDVIGATLPGVPGVAIGRNRHIAWGTASAEADVQDLYVIAQGEMTDGGIRQPLRVEKEVIRVKGASDVTLNVRHTRHGPLISDLFPTPIPTALRWSALDEADSTLTAYLNLNRARNWSEFTRALVGFHVPVQSFVYADVQGNIGYILAGSIPKRQGDGTLPVTGATAGNWQGYFPAVHLPRAYNPRQGYLVAANNRVTSEQYPYLISRSWAAPYRAQRIQEVLTSRPKLSFADMIQLQNDTRSSQVADLLPNLLKARPINAQGDQALAQLRAWDGRLRPESAQAALYEAWYAELAKAIFGDELGDELGASYSANYNSVALSLAAQLARESPWCDNVLTSEVVEDCATILGGALEAGISKMARLQGTASLTRWEWGRVHRALFPSILGEKTEEGLAIGGDYFTVNVAPASPRDPYNQYFGPAYRQVIDLKSLSSSRFVLAPRQSQGGNDLSRLWRQGGYLDMRYEKAALVGVVQRKLILKPKKRP